MRSRNCGVPSTARCQLDGRKIYLIRELTSRTVVNSWLALSFVTLGELLRKKWTATINNERKRKRNEIIDFVSCGKVATCAVTKGKISFLLLFCLLSFFSPFASLVLLTQTSIESPSISTAFFIKSRSLRCRNGCRACFLTSSWLR